MIQFIDPEENKPASQKKEKSLNKKSTRYLGERVNDYGFQTQERISETQPPAMKIILEALCTVYSKLALKIDLTIQTPNFSIMTKKDFEGLVNNTIEESIAEMGLNNENSESVRKTVEKVSEQQFEQAHDVQIGQGPKLT